MARKKRKSRSRFDSGIASEFLVLSNLFRKGANAFISLGNKKSIDIMIYPKKGPAVSVDVKSVRAYSSINVNNVKAKRNHYIVAVVYQNKFAQINVMPVFYIIPSSAIAGVQKRFSKGQRRLMVGDIQGYLDKWAPLIK